MKAVAKVHRIKQRYWSFSGAKGAKLDIGGLRILVRGKVRECSLECGYFLFKMFAILSLPRQETGELSRKSLTNIK